MRALILLCTSAFSLLSFAGETKDPETLLTVRGKILKEESFKDESAIKKGGSGGWYIYKGDYQVQNESLRCVERPDDGHHPAMSCKLPSHNLIMQCKFKTDASKWLSLSLDNGKLKEHIFRAWISPTGFSLKRMSGMGPTTKGENLAEKKFKFEPGNWYTLIVEMNGKEVCAQIPEAGITIYGEHDALDVEKDRFELISGGDAAWFDEIKIWEATPNPKWPQIKAQIPPPTVAKKK
jgi:hypothetical protein